MRHILAVNWSRTGSILPIMGYSEMPYSEAWWSPYIFLSVFGLFLFLLYLLRRWRRLVRVTIVVAVVLMLMSIALERPDDISPFESAFWKALKLRSWQDILRTALMICFSTLLWMRLDMEMKRRRSGKLE